MEKTKVFIIDDSAIVREILSTELSKHPMIEVVGVAIDPYIARNKLEQLEVDVIILDIEMPRMDGLTFLKYLMKYRPIPTIIMSSLTNESNQATQEALSLGAVEVMNKPGGPFSVGDVIKTLTEKIITMKSVNFSPKPQSTSSPSPQKKESHTRILSRIETTEKLIAVGVSTGGTIALEKLFHNFDVNFPATVAVIHMPERFTHTFANRLNDICSVNVKEAVHNEKLLPGWIYIAPGGYHMSVKSIGADRVIKITNGPKVFNQRPAVDILFNSVADNVGQNAIGIILTGMGKDGAAGLLNIKEAGGYTIAQDEKSSMVWGMPKEAIDLGAAQKILPLENIAADIKQMLFS